MVLTVDKASLSIQIRELLKELSNDLVSPGQGGGGGACHNKAKMLHEGGRQKRGEKRKHLERKYFLGADNERSFGGT